MKSKIEKFEDLTVWQESVNLAETIYKTLAQCNDFGLRDQIRRAAISVPSNIAEGFDRQTNKEFIQFLHIAKGSAAEVRTQIYLAVRLKYIDQETGDLLLDQTRKISSMLFKLIQIRKERF
ncbi:four helix bundle protein [Alkalitalea saponilacus]|uniref:Four helix bundle protein n=1 Tax=Alkalitalea saponilacus TaxID=889453 RepID=A0A1T5CYI8_9BACT|nr:four helix bundle protein [Alkalitalea saponilacus]ASB50524.1 four helix bundle protein [Alkalitalea saponilacus]SKB64280.1 four helix bundle protein [Alkalitalea saponilacus]